MIGEKWEVNRVDSLKYDYILRGGNIQNAHIKKFNEDVPCYLRTNEKLCEGIGSNTKGCIWNESDHKCTIKYTGGYTNFFIIMSVSIYLLTLGVILTEDQDEIKTSDDFKAISTISIIAGSIGILFSLFDLIIC